MEGQKILNQTLASILHTSSTSNPSVQFSFASIISKYMNFVTLLDNVYVVILSYILIRNMNSFLCINFQPVYNDPR